MRGYQTKVRIFAAMVALMLLSGCAATPMTTQLTASPPLGMSTTFELNDVPFFAQTVNHCGPAALATVLNSSGLKTTPEYLATSIYTPGRDGTLQTEIITGARRQARLALPVRSLDVALDHITQGRPVLILQNLGLDIAPFWHYAVIIGFDIPNETLLLRSGTTRRQTMAMQTFEHTWRRADYWGVVMVKPAGPIPQKTEISEWLNEAYGLERAGQELAALTAYSTAAQHWPGAATPLIFSANLLIRKERLLDATIDLRAAVQRDPINPSARNNLAHVLMLQGMLGEAEAHAQKAVEYGAGMQDTATQTLSAIRQKKAEQR